MRQAEVGPGGANVFRDGLHLGAPSVLGSGEFPPTSTLQTWELIYVPSLSCLALQEQLQDTQGDDAEKLSASERLQGGAEGTGGSRSAHVAKTLGFYLDVVLEGS